MNGSTFVDTNVLAYTRDASKPDKQTQAAEWISYLWRTGNGRLSLQVLAEFYAVVTALLNDQPEEAVRRMNWYYDVFGPDRFFVELQQHNIKEITDLNRKLLERGARYSAKYIATNDVHYINQDDARLQDILLAIQTQTLLSDKERMRMTDDSYYLRTPEEMSRLFAEVPEALSNTLLIAERCNVDLSFKTYHLPDFPVPDGFTAETRLRYLCEQGARNRYRDRSPVTRRSTG